MQNVRALKNKKRLAGKWKKCGNLAPGARQPRQHLNKAKKLPKGNENVQDKIKACKS